MDIIPKALLTELVSGTMAVMGVVVVVGEGGCYHCDRCSTAGKYLGANVKR